MSKRTKGYIAALVLVCIAVIAHFTAKETVQEYVYKEGKIENIIEYEMEVDEYSSFVYEAMHQAEVMNQLYFHNEEMEKAIGTPKQVKRYVISKKYGEWFAVQATAVTWKDEGHETLVFAYTELLDDSDLVEYTPLICDNFGIEEEIFGYFRYTIGVKNTAQVNAEELQQHGFSLSEDESSLFMNDGILLQNDIQIDTSLYPDYAKADYEYTELNITEKVQELITDGGSIREGDYQIHISRVLDGKVQGILQKNIRFAGEGPSGLVTKCLFLYDLENEEVEVLKELEEDTRVVDYIYSDNTLYYSTIETLSEDEDATYEWKLYIEETFVENGTKILVVEGYGMEDTAAPKFMYEQGKVFYIAEKKMSTGSRSYEYAEIVENAVENIRSIPYTRGKSTALYYEDGIWKKHDFEEQMAYCFDLGDVLYLRFEDGKYNQIFDKWSKRLKETKDERYYGDGISLGVNSAFTNYFESDQTAYLLWNENEKVYPLKVELPETGVTHFCRIEDEKVLVQIGNKYYQIAFYR